MPATADRNAHAPATTNSRHAPRELEPAQLEAALRGGAELAVLDFSAPWCGPCRMLEPVLGELAADFEGRADFFKVDADQSPELAMRYGVQAVPTLVFLRRGEVVDRVVGLRSKAELAERLREHGVDAS